MLRYLSLVDGYADGRVTLGELVDRWTPYVDDLHLHDAGGPGECLVRRGQLLVGTDSVDPVVERLRRWVDTVEPDETTSTTRLRLRGSEDRNCIDIAREVGAAPNHVHLGSPLLFGTPVMFGTGAEARPAPSMPEPEDTVWDPPVRVGLLDTGLDPHPWFADRDWFQPVREVLDADDDAGQDRQAGHGTFVAGVLLQHAPGIAVRAERVLSSLGFTDDLTVAGGLRALRARAEARGERIDVVVLTAGCHTADDTCPPVLATELSEFPAVVAAAGNLGSQRPFWPAALPEVLAVAATGRDGATADFSNTGTWVDAAAPGVGVASSHVRMVAGSADRDYGFARWSGTSFAAPAVAAEVARGLHEGETPAHALAAARRRYPFGR